MAFGIGQTIGDYEFLDILESSKNGVTYKVRNVLAQRFEALKVLPKNLQDDQENVDRFLREMKVHARLTHPNIVAFYNAGQVEKQLIMTTELTEGLTLAQRQNGAPLPIPEAIDYISQVLAALSYAHSQGVVHREVTPSNITVTPDGTVKLSGFGLAKAINDPQLTQVGAMLGSLHYMAPEQVKGISTVDARADIYAVGTVLYEAVTGKPPFHAESHFDIMVAHVNKVPQAPQDLNPGVPEELSQIIQKALAKDPADRFQTADEMREAIENMAEQPAAAPAQQARAEAPRHEPAPHPQPAKPAPLPTLLRAAGPAQTGRPSVELMAAGVFFVFIIVAVAFFAFLTITKL